MAPLGFKCVLNAQEPIAGLFWEPCLPVLHVFQTTGRERLIDVSRDSACGSRSIPALERAERFEPSPCGRYRAIARGGQLAVWNSQKNEIVPAPPNASVIEQMAWNPRSSVGELWLAGSFGLATWSAGGDFSIRSHDPRSDTTALAWDPTGTYLARACKRGGLVLWNECTNQRVRLERPGGHPIRQFAWNSSGAILTGTSGTSVFFWSIPAALHGKRDAQSVRRISAPVSQLAFRPRSNIVAVGRIDGALELLREVESGEARRRAQLGAVISHLAWSPNGKQLAVATSSGQVYATRVCR